MKAARSRKAITSGNDQDVPRGPERPFEIVAADLRRSIAADEWQSGEAQPQRGTVGSLALAGEKVISRPIQPG